MEEERERQEVLSRELEEMRKGLVVDAERAPERYVRMELMAGESWRWEADGRRPLRLYPITENVDGRLYRVLQRSSSEILPHTLHLELRVPGKQWIAGQMMHANPCSLLQGRRKSRRYAQHPR